MNQIVFKRKISELVAVIENDALILTCGWAVPIYKSEAIAYAKVGYQSNGDGFYHHEDHIILQHKHAKIKLSVAEAHAIINLIKNSYQNSASSKNSRTSDVQQNTSELPRQSAPTTRPAVAAIWRLLVGLLWPFKKPPAAIDRKGL